MGLFSRKNNDYETASKELNASKATYASERLIMEQIKDDDERACELVDKLKEGSPLIINFEKLPLMAINKLLAFFTGACYAVDGNTIKINEFTYLFARKVDFLDGTLNNFIEKL